MNATTFGRFNRFGGALDIRFFGTSERAYNRVFGDFCNLAHGFKIAVRCHCKASLNHIHAHAVERFCDHQLFGQRHGVAGGLFAVAQRGVEYDDAILGHKEFLEYVSLGIIRGWDALGQKKSISL